MGSSCCQKQIQTSSPLNFNISYTKDNSYENHKTNDCINDNSNYFPISLKKPILLKLVQKTIVRYSNIPTRANSNKSLQQE